MCQATLFKDLEYNHEQDTDHFFRHNLESMVNSFEKDDAFPSYQEFEKLYKDRADEILNLSRFLDGISPIELRLRWTRLFSLHLLLVSFLNGYGYSFQYTDTDQIKSINKTLLLHKNGTVVLSNFYMMLSRIQLSENKHILAMMNAKNT